VTILSTTTGLLSVLAVDINRLGDCFLVCYLRCTNICFYLEFTKQTIYDNFQVKFAHSGDDCLSCFLVCMSTESRIFFCKFCKSFAHLTLIILCLRLNSQLNNRFWEFHGLQNNRMLFITDCITCCCDLKTNSCCDISGVNLVNLSSAVSVHLKDTSNTFLLILCCIQDIRT